MRAVGLLMLAAGSLVPSGCGYFWGCKHAEVTAVSLNACDRHCGKDAGIPFYLPKPLLVVSKNFRNIEEARTGLTDSAPIPQGFDDQSKYADLNARTNFAGLQSPGGTPDGGTTSGAPGAGVAVKSEPRLHSSGAPLSPNAAPFDGLSPATFFTYQIVFVPDMTQKYGLRIKGGPGEIRAAMNLVNGWQFTGLGPFYLKDSSTAQNVLASGISARLGGQAAADVLNASANLAKAALPGAPGGGGTSAELDASHPAASKLAHVLGSLPLNCTPCKIENFAEIHVYEPHLTPDGRMEWSEIVNLKFDRDYLGTAAAPTPDAPTKDKAAPPTIPPPGGTTSADLSQLNGVQNELGKAALSAVFGIGLSGAPAAPAGGTTSGALGAPPAGSVNQIQVDCDGNTGHKGKSFSLFSFHRDKKAPAPRPTIATRSITIPAGAGTGGTPSTDPLQTAPKKKNETAPPPGGTKDP
jgi:hypothetical protein